MDGKQRVNKVYLFQVGVCNKCIFYYYYKRINQDFDDEKGQVRSC